MVKFTKNVIEKMIENDDGQMIVNGEPYFSAFTGDANGDSSVAWEQMAMRWQTMIFDLFLNFDGTITVGELIDRMVAMMLPYWDDDGYTAVLWSDCKNNPIKHIPKVVVRLAEEVKNDFGLTIDDEVDSEEANKIFESFVA